MDDRNQFRKQADHPPFQDLGNIRDDFMDDRHLFKKQTDHRPLQDSRNITEDFMDDQNHSRLEQRMEELGEQTPLQDSFDRLDRQGIASLLQERISLLDGKLVHAHIVTSGLEQDMFLANLLMSMYSRYGLVDEARAVFDGLRQRTVVSWSAMISAYSQHGRGREALALFLKMQQHGVKPNNITFVSVLTACANTEALAEGTVVHAQTVEIGSELAVVVGTALINMYAKCGTLENALLIFHKMPVRDTVCWNALIAAYAQDGYGTEAVQLFKEMQQENMKADRSTFISTLSACANAAAITEGKVIHACIVNHRLETDVSLGNALVYMYGKCGAMEDAVLVFDKMQQRDVVSWNSMIAGYAQEGLCDEALELFQQMLSGGIKPTHVTYVNLLSACTCPEALVAGKIIHAHIVQGGNESDVVAGTALVYMYGTCGTVVDARAIFNKIQGCDVICWNAMITIYAQQGYGLEALQLFHQMQLIGLSPDEVTFSSILSACSDLAALEEGKLVHRCVLDSGFDSSIVVGNALIHMYGKCGRLDEARALFDNMSPQKLVSWNAMITAYAQQGHGKRAVELFEQMKQEDVRPNEVTFVSLLSACSHAGLLEEGHAYFSSMSADHGITPLVEHYVCLIDLLGRLGRLEEAENLINKMSLPPTGAVWSALLGGCRIHGDVERAKRAAEHMFNLDFQSETPYVLLSNIYSSEGRWEDAERVRRAMADRGVKDEPGCTWIEIENKVHRFFVRDQSHPQALEILAKLRVLE